MAGWLSAIPIGIGALQAIQGFSALNKLQGQALPMYSEDPEMKASRLRAQGMANQGYTSAETAAFNNRANATDNQRYNLATNVAGGNAAGAINAGIQYGNINRELGFAAQDAQLRRQNMKYADSFSTHLQRLRDANTSYMQQRRAQQENAAGGAVQAGINNIAAGGMMAGVDGAGQGFGQGQGGGQGGGFNQNQLQPNPTYPQPNYQGSWGSTNPPQMRTGNGWNY